MISTKQTRQTRQTRRGPRSDPDLHSPPGTSLQRDEIYSLQINLIHEPVTILLLLSLLHWSLRLHFKSPSLHHLPFLFCCTTVPSPGQDPDLILISQSATLIQATLYLPISTSRSEETKNQKPETSNHNPETTQTLHRGRKVIIKLRFI